jgi:hypothetical protein
LSTLVSKGHASVVAGDQLRKWRDRKDAGNEHAPKARLGNIERHVTNALELVKIRDIRCHFQR